MGKHADQHMMVPAKKFSDLVMVHAQLAFAFFKALFNRPTHSAKPDKKRQPRTQRSVADKKGVRGIRPDGSLHNQPDFPVRKACFGQYDSAFGEFVYDGSLGAFGNGSSVPEKMVDTASQIHHRYRFLFARPERLFLSGFAPVAVFFFHGYRPPQPALGFTVYGQKVDFAGMPGDRFDKIRVAAIYAVGGDVFYRQAEMGGYENYELVIREGTPYLEILKYAQEKTVDLIALAHHSGSIFQPRDQMGSTVEKVVLGADCPVVSLKRLDVLEDYSAFRA
jgi:nucleotide-binding universal stress UspA family protein